MAQEKASSSFFLLLFGLVKAENEVQEAQEENDTYKLHIKGIRRMNPNDPEKVGQQLACEAAGHVWKTEEFEKMNMSKEELEAFKTELEHLQKQQRCGRGSKRQKLQD